MADSYEGAGLVDSPIRGIILISLGVTVLSVQDVIIRLLSGEYSAFEIVFIRSVIAIIPITLFVYLGGGFKTLRMCHPILNLTRSGLMFFSYLTYYSALAAIPIAEATAIFFASPLITTGFSVLFLKEYVGVRSWVAVFTGFAGVMVIVQPGSETMNPAAFLPIMAAFTYSLSIMITRRLGPSQTGASLAFYGVLLFIIFSTIIGISFGDGRFATQSHPSLAFLLREWIMPTRDDFMLLTLCGVVAAFGIYCLSQSYRIAPVSTLAPFEYVAMPCAVLWGFIFWSEIPSITTSIGIFMIISSGLYVLHRESVAKNQHSKN